MGDERRKNKLQLTDVVFNIPPNGIFIDDSNGDQNIPVACWFYWIDCRVQAIVDLPTSNLEISNQKRVV